MKYLKDSIVTVTISGLFAGTILMVSSYYRLSVPEPHQRPIFFIGIILFSLAFRLLLSMKEE